MDTMSKIGDDLDHVFDVEVDRVLSDNGIVGLV